MPKRIQLKRRKGWRMPANTVVVSRPSRWGNPYKIEDMVGGKSSRQQLAKDMFQSMAEQNRDYQLEAQLKLRGKNLACWCKPGDPCHADVLLEIANR